MEQWWELANESWIFGWVVVPLLIAAARVVDVGIGTVRLVFITRGRKLLAAVLGFFEILVWLLAIGQILSHLTNPIYYIAYAGGFATGTYVGIWIESKLALGTVLVRVVTRRSAEPLIERLKQDNYRLTYLDAHGATGTVQILFTLVRRQNAPRVIRLIQQYNPNAFYSVEDVRFVSEPVPAADRLGSRLLHPFRWLPKRK
jgi:uncharacterized protein YebE (UPF0316 family)